MKPIRLIGFTCMMACGASAIVAASASALPPPFEFKAETYPVEVRGAATRGASFEFAGVVLACRNASFNTNEEGAPNPAKESRTLLVHPIYTDCRTTLAPARVLTTGCNYRFHAVKPEEKTGTMDIPCAAGKGIEVELLGISGCVIQIPPQTALVGIEYLNEGGPPKKVEVNAEVEKIRFKASSQCGLGVVEGTNGNYRGSAVFNGFKPGTTAADGLEVDR